MMLLSTSATLVLATLVALVAAKAEATMPPPIRCQHTYRFAAWARTFNRSYPDDDEWRYRCNVFSTNSRRVARHNADPASTWTATTQQPYTDLTDAEYRAVRCRGRRPSPVPVGPLRTPFSFKVPTLLAGDHALYGFTTTATPRTTSHWALGQVTPAKDQGQYGTCWAQAGVGMLEYLYTTTNRSVDLVPFSAQQLSDCTGGIDSCNGGWTIDALNYAKTNGGVATQADYPYVGCGVCNASAPVVPLNITAVVSVADEPSLIAAVQYTVVTVAIDASGVGFGSYASGVYNGVFDGQPDCCNDPGCLDHEVLLTGYVAAKKHRDEAYYIIKNSWGANWGRDDGFVFFKAGTNVCGVAVDPVYAVAN